MISGSASPRSSFGWQSKDRNEPIDDPATNICTSYSLSVDAGVVHSTQLGGGIYVGAAK
jgi:hypothetical protein